MLITKDLVLDFDRVYRAANTLPYERKIVPLRASLVRQGPVFGQQYRTAAERKGILYEERTQLELLTRHGCQYLPSPWFLYETLEFDRPRFCQPDALLIQPELGKITIIEIKVNFIQAPKAFNQLVNLYEPVVNRVFNGAWERKRPVPQDPFSSREYGAPHSSSHCLSETPPWKIAVCLVSKFVDGTHRFPLPMRVISSIEQARLGDFSVHIFNPKKVLLP